LIAVFLTNFARAAAQPDRHAIELLAGIPSITTASGLFIFLAIPAAIVQPA